jgi:hypothetical protein
MRLVQENDRWLLIDETSPGGRVIATLRDRVEVVAFAEYAKLTLSAPRKIPEHFRIRHDGAEYTVTPIGSPGERLSLVISGARYSATVATEFRMPRAGE